MNERPTDKVNYILDAHWYRESSHQKYQLSISKSIREENFPLNIAENLTTPSITEGRTDRHIFTYKVASLLIKTQIIQIVILLFLTKILIDDNFDINAHWFTNSFKS